MIRVAIINSEGKTVLPAELSSLTELQQAVEQARNLIRDCERLAHAKNPKNSPAQARQVPYSS